MSCQGLAPDCSRSSGGSRPDTPVQASVIIPSYNRRAKLARCINSLLRQGSGVPPFEIVIVDDGSTDGTARMVAALGDRLRARRPCTCHSPSPPPPPSLLPPPSCSRARLTLLKQPRSGAAAARNRGARSSRGRILVFLDSDTLVGPGFVDAHVRAHEGTGRWAVRGPVVSVPESWSRGRVLRARAGIGDVSAAFFAAGNASVARDDFVAAGMFDEGFVEYGWEDLELGRRLKALGLAGRLAAEAVAYHLRPPASRADSDTLEAMRRAESARGRTAVLYLRKHPCLAVRLSTMAHPLFFALDRVLAAAHWPDSPAAGALVTGLSRSPARALVPAVTRIMRYHWYADSLRCALKAPDELKGLKGKGGGPEPAGSPDGAPR